MDIKDFVDMQDISYCIDAHYSCGTSVERYIKKKKRQLIMEKENNKIRIRRLTPKECWRLMGFSDKDFDAAKQAGISDSQLYKQAGNSIVTDVLYHIFKELYNAMPYLFEDLKVGSYFSGIGAFEIGLDRLFADINADASGVRNKSSSTTITTAGFGKTKIRLAH